MTEILVSTQSGLKSAIENASSGDTIKLGCDVTVDSQISISNKNITIDMAGYDIAVSCSGYAFNVNCTVEDTTTFTIKDSTYNEDAGVKSEFISTGSSTGLVTITGSWASTLDFSNISVHGGEAGSTDSYTTSTDGSIIFDQNGKKVYDSITLTNTSIYTGNTVAGGSYGDKDMASALFTVTGGTFTGSRGFLIYNDKQDGHPEIRSKIVGATITTYSTEGGDTWGSAIYARRGWTEIRDCTIEGTTGNDFVVAGYENISTGDSNTGVYIINTTVTAHGNALAAVGGQKRGFVYIYGGTFSSDSTNSESAVIRANSISSDGSKLEIYGGTIDASKTHYAIYANGISENSYDDDNYPQTYIYIKASGNDTPAFVGEIQNADLVFTSGTDGIAITNSKWVGIALGTGVYKGVTTLHDNTSTSSDWKYVRITGHVTLDVANGGKFQYGGSEDTADALLTSGYENCKIYADMADVTADQVLLIDYLGSNTKTLSDYSMVQFTNNPTDDGYSLAVQDNDLYAKVICAWRIDANDNEYSYFSLAEALDDAQSDDKLIKAVRGTFGTSNLRGIATLITKKANGNAAQLYGGSYLHASEIADPATVTADALTSTSVTVKDMTAAPAENEYTVKDIYGGSNVDASNNDSGHLASTVGTTNVTASGANSAIRKIYGGSIVTLGGGNGSKPQHSATATVTTANITVDDSAKVEKIIAGGRVYDDSYANDPVNAAESTVTTANVTIGGGATVGTVYGGGLYTFGSDPTTKGAQGTVSVGTANIVVNEATVGTIYAGGFVESERASVTETETVSVTVDTANITLNSGATVTNVYGTGCWEGDPVTGITSTVTTSNLLLNGGNITSGTVSGFTTVTISSTDNLPTFSNIGTLNVNAAVENALPTFSNVGTLNIGTAITLSAALDIADTNLGITADGSLAANGKAITVTNLDIANAGTLAITPLVDKAKPVKVSGSVKNQGTITVDLTNASNLAYLLVDYTGTGTEPTLDDFGTVTLTGSANYNVQSLNGDLYAVQEGKTIAEATITWNGDDVTVDTHNVTSSDGLAYVNDVTAGSGSVTINNNGKGSLQIETVSAKNDITISSQTSSVDTFIVESVVSEEKDITITHEGSGEMVIGDITAESSTGNITITNKTTDTELNLTGDISAGATVKIVNETGSAIAASGKIKATNVIVENNVADTTNKGVINLTQSIDAAGYISITNSAANSTATSCGSIHLGGTTEATKHTAANGLTIVNAENNVINGSGSAADNNELAAYITVTGGNVTITNEGHLNLVVVCTNGDINITNGSSDTLIGSYTGQNVTVTNTATGTAHDVTFVASTGDITLVNDGELYNVTMTTGDTKKIAISYSGSAAPEAITNAIVTTGDLYLGGESLEMADGDVTTVHLGKATATSAATDVAGGEFTWNGGDVDTITGSLASVHGSAVINKADALKDVAITNLDKVTIANTQSFDGTNSYRMDALEIKSGATLTWDKVGEQSNIGTVASATDRIAVTGTGTLAFEQNGTYALNDMDLEDFDGSIKIGNSSNVAAILNLTEADALKSAANILEGANLDIDADQSFNNFTAANNLVIDSNITVAFEGNNVFSGELQNSGTVTFNAEKSTTLNGNSAKLVNNNDDAQAFEGELHVNRTGVDYTTATIYDIFATGDWGFVKDETLIYVGSYYAKLGQSFKAGSNMLWIGSNNGKTGITSDTLTLNGATADADTDFQNFNSSDAIRDTYTKFSGTIKAQGTFKDAGGNSLSIYGEYGTLDLDGDIDAKYIFGGTLDAMTDDDKTLAIDQTVKATGIFGRDQFQTTYFAPTAGLNGTATKTTVSVAASTTVNTTFLAGGSLMNGNRKFTIADGSETTLTVDSSDVTATLVTGGSIVGGRTKLTDNGDVELNLNAGTYTYVAGAGYLQRNTATLTHTGDISINISGGSYKYVYGGAAAREPQYTVKATIKGNIDITVDTTSNTVSLGYLFGGNSGKDHGQIKCNTTITFKGDGSKLDFSLATEAEGLAGVCGGSAVKASHSSPVTGYTRTLAFNNFTGNFAAPVIESFETISLSNGSNVTFTSTDLALAEVKTWNLAANTTLTWAKGYENSFDGDTLNFGVDAQIVSSADGDDLFADLEKAKSVTLGNQTATWDASNSRWASSSYQLSYNTDNHKLAVVALA